MNVLKEIARLHQQIAGARSDGTDVEQLMRDVLNNPEMLAAAHVVSQWVSPSPEAQRRAMLQNVDAAMRTLAAGFSLPVDQVRAVFELERAELHHGRQSPEATAARRKVEELVQ